MRALLAVGDPCNSNTHFSGLGCHCHCRDEIEGANCRECRISRIELPWRGLEGTLPPSLSLLSRIAMFDLSHNKLSGT